MLSKKGSPRPILIFLAVTVTSPPTESPASKAFLIVSSIAVLPPTSDSVASICIGLITFLATTPAATIAAVSLPEKCPPPR